MDLTEARVDLATFVATFGKTGPKAVACLEDGFEDAPGVLVLPEKYRKRLRTTNMQERLNEEVRRRVAPPGSSRTPTRPCALSAPCWPNRTRSGPNGAPSTGRIP